MIEVTNYREREGELLRNLNSGDFLKENLKKLYGVHAHLSLIGKRPAEHVLFAIVVGSDRMTAAQRGILRNRIARVTDQIGPSFFNQNRPQILVDSIDSWNGRKRVATISEAPA